MRFSLKVLLCTVLVIATVFSIGGYILISRAFEADVERETDRALEEYTMARYSFQSQLLTAELQFGTVVTEDMMPRILEQTARVVGGRSIAIYNADRELIAASPAYFTPDLPLDAVSDDTRCYQISENDGSHVLEVASRFENHDSYLYLVTSRDISEVFVEHEASIRLFVLLDVIMVGISAVIMLVLSYVLTRPILQLKRSAKRIANGGYHERVNVRGNDEISELARSFNDMAEAVEKNVSELEQHAVHQRDFVANFSHELKTPLTSIIGYADTLRSAQLGPEDTFEAASFIFSEGKRLESLSLKLLDLIVLEKTDFKLKIAPAQRLIERASATLAPLLKESGVTIDIKAQKRRVIVESDLVLTLIINILDNARKACDEGGHITVTGKEKAGRYVVCVKDNGRGIPADELERITEAFYMVDKSRARKQHGAGLGLALASRICEIHATRLDIVSTVGEGTTVSFSFAIAPPRKQS